MSEEPYNDDFSENDVQVEGTGLLPPGKDEGLLEDEQDLPLLGSSSGQSSLACSSSVLDSAELKPRATDIKEQQKIDSFMEKSCGCKNGPKKLPCSKFFPREVVASFFTLPFLHDQMGMGS